MDFWLTLALLAPIFGFAFWYVMSASHGFLWLEGFRDRLRFFFSPSGPWWYVLLKRLDGNIEDFFDVKVVKAKGGYEIRAGGLQMIMDVDPDDVAELVALTDARGPPGYPSPYGLAWRCLCGWAVALYAAYLAWNFTFLADVVDNVPPRPVSWICFMAWVVLFMYTMMVMHKINTPTIKYLGLVEVGLNPPHVRVVPELSVMSRKPVPELLRFFARDVHIHVPEALKNVVDELKKKLGSEALAAALLAHAEMAIMWRKSLVEAQREKLTVKEVARTYVMTQALRSMFKPTFAKVLFWVFLVGLGFALGYMFGANWAVSTVPPLNITAIARAAQAPAPAAITTITPAPLPRPPVPAKPSVIPAPAPTVTPAPNATTVTPAPAPTVR